MISNNSISSYANTNSLNNASSKSVYFLPSETDSNNFLEDNIAIETRKIDILSLENQLNKLLSEKHELGLLHNVFIDIQCERYSERLKILNNKLAEVREEKIGYIHVADGNARFQG